MKKVFLFLVSILLLISLSSCAFFRNIITGGEEDSLSFIEITDLIERDLGIDVSNLPDASALEYYYYGYYEEQEDTVVFSFLGETFLEYDVKLERNNFINYFDSGEYYSPDETYSVFSQGEEEVVIFVTKVYEDIKTNVTQNNIYDYNMSTFGMSGLPAIGTYDVLVVPVDFSDDMFTESELSTMETIFNGDRQSTGWESVSTYYYKSSNGKLDMNFEIASVFHTNRLSFIYESDNGDRRVINEYINSMTEDLTKYDTNLDGYIDSIIFVYSVSYDENENPWWAYCSILDERVNPDLKLGYYCWISYEFAFDEFYGVEEIDINAATFIHEVGHLLGADDYYSYNNFGPLGGYDMMDQGIGDHNPFTKMLFGWEQPKEFVYNEEFVLGDYGTTGDFILIPYDSTNVFNEYLLIINFGQTGLYEGFELPGLDSSSRGLLVYHIDARVIKNPTHPFLVFLNSNLSNLSKKLIEIISSNPNNPIEESSLNSNDLFPINGQFSLNYAFNQDSNLNLNLNASFNNSDNSVKLTISQ